MERSSTRLFTMMVISRGGGRCLAVSGFDSLVIRSGKAVLRSGDRALPKHGPHASGGSEPLHDAPRHELRIESRLHSDQDSCFLQ